jgi:Xaa-Pro aminopeptidase
MHRRALLGSLAASGLTLGNAAAQENTYGTPGPPQPFGPEVFRERRRRLMDQMGGGVAVIYSATTLEGEGQDPDFLYLTGIVDEVNAALVLAPEERLIKDVLFLANRDVENERWEGERMPVGTVVEARTGFADVKRMSQLGGQVTGMASRAGTLHFMGPIVGPTTPVPRAMELYRNISARVPGVDIENSAGMIAWMREQKEPREVALIRRAIAATERGHRAAMRQARVGMHEYDVKDIIENEFRAEGARGLAFPSIVGAGRNSAVLHYPLDNNTIQAGDMVLCDLGAKYDQYCADITRTFPISGRYNDEQRRIYELVLQAQEAAARVARPGVYYSQLQEAADNVFRQAGLIDSFWHGLGHFVGLEVHDAGDYNRPLPVGACFTIEPGLYLPDRGFGVRIEDMYLLTRNGCEHMTASVPRTVAEVEAWMAGGA